ncbi:metallophosphoesterase family protein [Geoalkalibacter halelectricus]|uniref:metallophosphoesterase family protein n=1 Tax=Geoalkalibacter halelectricus TaxID=2847045 RepID=UPI003D241708
MIRILHTADLHLDAPFVQLGDKAGQRQDDFLKTFERLLTLAIKNEVHLFVVAGDLFDHSRPDSGLVGRVQAGLKRLADRGIVPVLIPGTHDNVIAPDSVYRRHEFPGALVLQEPCVEEPACIKVQGTEVFLYGFAYRSSVSEDALASLRRRGEEGLHIGLLHGAREGSPEWDYRKKDLPFNLALLKGLDLDYVALGHYHEFEVLSDEGRTWACYPGSPEGKRFGENGPRHCALVTLAPRSAKVEKLLCNTRTLDERTLDLGGCPGEAEAAAAIAALGNPDLLLRLTLTGVVEAPLDLVRLQALLGGQFFHLDLIDRTGLYDSRFARRIEDEQTVRGLFVRRARERIGAADAEERLILEEAFREVLVRFRAFGGGAP